METIMPPRLRSGDTIRVVAPSAPLEVIPYQARERINERIMDYLGAKVSYGKEYKPWEEPTTEDRVNELTWAFDDDRVDAIFAATGGFNSNDILSYCKFHKKAGDRLWSAIRNNPKIFCGFSDNSMINNAIFAKTGLITYYGQNYLSMNVRSEDDFKYMMRQCHDCLVREGRYFIKYSKSWSDELHMDFENPKQVRFHNNGPRVLGYPPKEKVTTNVLRMGRIAVGCMRNLSLMNNTPYQARFDQFDEGTVLFLEDTMVLSAEGLRRELVSLALHDDWKGVNALIIGRIPHDHKGAFAERKLKEIGEAANLGPYHLDKLLESLKYEGALGHIATVASAFDLGHTVPSTLLPVGGWAQTSVTPQGHLSVEVSHTPFLGSKSIVKKVPHA